MVAPVSPRFGFVPEVNLSRSYLLRAYDKLQAGDVISAGVLMREGVITHLRAMAAWYDCEPKVKKAKRKKFLRPADYILALDKAGKLGDCREWFDDMIAVGNKCAHAMPISASMVECCISFAHVMIDGCPCGSPTDRPTTKLVKPEPECGCDDGDGDDGAGWWKGGAV